MTVFDIRASDKGPGKARPPRIKQPRTPTPPPSGGGKKSLLGCPLSVAATALALLAACIPLLEHGP